MKNTNINNNSSINNNENPVPISNPPIIIKKARPKTASPTRHGPQQCQVCNKVFGNASALAKHKLTHSDERKYVCGMCSKAFKRQDHLNGHMLTHRNKKPYECKAEGCGKSYCDARSLRRHTENHHTTVPISPITLATANTTIHHLQNHNQHFSPMLSSTGPPSSLSLSPSTACGDASSPHGATCIQFSTSSTICNADSNSKTLPHSQDGGKNLTSQHINLINHIMQQSKYANENNSLIAPVITSTNNNNSTSVDDNNGLHKQRPRTWNMQTQLQQANISPILESCITTNGISTTSAIHVLTKLEQKPVECNLCHRKFKNIPALNGHMRLHGGYFKKDSENKKSDKKDFSGPPLQTASLGIRALIEEKIISKRGKDLKGAFVTPAPPLNILTSHDITESKNVTPKDSCNISELQTANAYKKAIANCGLPLHTSTETGVILPKVINSAAITYNRPNPLPAKRNDGRDSTLIELLKRGTKIEVKRNGEESVFEIATRTHNLIDISNPVTPISTPPPTINNTRPLSLTISPVNPSDGSDIFTLSYSSDVPTAFFANTESDVYNISDSSMLLQAVDSITELDEISNIKNFSLSDADQSHIMASYIPSNQLRTVLNSPLPDSLAEFSTLHSKELILYGSSNPSQVLHTSISPLPSPFAYPTPPASHETIPQASPFLDDSHHFSDGRQFFDDKKNELSFLDENNSETFIDATDNFKSELLNNVEKDHDLYDTSVEDILVSTDTTDDSHGQNDNLIDFNANLTFFDESHNFLETTNSPDNPTSPLSAAFFSSTMSSAEKVKEALQEVLPDDNILHSRGSRNSVNNNISLYYLPAISMQSNIMLNSDDPLLSSSPKDYAVNKQVIAVTPRLDFNSFQSHQTDTTKKVNPSKSICDNVNVTFRSERTLSSVENYSKDKHSTFKDSIENTCINKSNNTERLTAGSITSDDLTSALLLRKRNHSNNLRNTCDSCEPLDKNKCVKINIYKSKMKVLSHHYIPAPMLDPKRLGIGLYSMFASDPANEDLLDDHIGFDDFIAETVSSNDIAIQSNTNIGSEFQANIPKLQNKKELLTTVQNQIHNSTFLIDNICNDQLQWDPSSLLNCRIDEQKLARFVELTKSSAIPSGSHSEETALKALLRANGNIPIAILSLMDTASLNAHKRWSQNEVEIFLRCLEEYGKNFYRISKEVLTKTTADCVEFYYFWKKLTIDYKISSTKDVNNSSDPLIKNRSIKMWSLTEQDGGNKPTSAYNSSSLTMQSVQHNLNTHSSQSECRPHVCEMPDCSASFTSKAALHGHTRIHCIGKNFNSTHQNQSNIQQMVHNQHNVGNNSQSSTVPGNMSLQILKSETSTSFIRDDFPCKVCGKGLSLLG